MELGGKLSAVVVVNDFEKFSTHTGETLLKGNESLIDDRIVIDNVENKSFTSMARALNFGLEQARNRVVICSHQDVIFAPDFVGLLQKQLSELPHDWGVLGTVGIGFDGRWYWGSDPDLRFPVRVQTLDELCLVVRKDSGLRFDDNVFDGFHCYGVDICLQAQKLGLGAYVVQSKFSHPGGQAWKDPALVRYQNRLLEKWRRIYPVIRTTNGVIRGNWRERVLFFLTSPFSQKLHPESSEGTPK